MNNKLYKVALYIRLSRKDGDKIESNSITNQRKLLRKYVDDHDDLIYHDEYVDDDFSGLDFNRPAFIRMMQDVEAGLVNCILVKDLSRFCRNHIDGDWYLERYFPEHDIRFIAITDSVDNIGQSYASYDMLTPFRNMLNENYARDISHKVHAALDSKRYSGDFVGAFASYGYQKAPHDHNKLVIDPYAANIVRRIFDMWNAGYGQQKIARTLNAEGVLCPSEYKKLQGYKYSNCNKLDSTKYWTYPTIHNILHKEMYRGDMVQGKYKRYMKQKARAVPKEDYIVVKNTHEAIIDESTWHKAQARFTRRTRNLDLDSNNSIFAGFLKCADCGRTLVKRKMHDGRLQYRCGTYVRLGNKYCTPHVIWFEVLERIILDDLNTIIGSLNNLKKIVSRLERKEEKSAEKGSNSLLLQELAKVKRMKQGIYEDYKDGIISKVEYFNYRQDYNEKEELLERHLQKMKEAEKLTPEEKIICSEWAKYLLKKKRIESLDRQIITEMIFEIKISEKNTIEITYNFSDDIDYLFKKNIEVTS